MSATRNWQGKACIYIVFLVCRPVDGINGQRLCAVGLSLCVPGSAQSDMHNNLKLRHCQVPCLAGTNCNSVVYLCCCSHAGKVYHLSEAGALSEAVRPLKADGSVDADVIARLSVRHDDSLHNVANRLGLWDRQVRAPGF